MDPHQHNRNIYNRYVAAYRNRFMGLDLYKDTFDPLLEALPRNGRVLELGCGPGNVAKYIGTRRPDLQYLGIDLAPEMIRAARKEHPDAVFRLMDIRHADQIGGVFDAVIAAFSIPYLTRGDVPPVFAHVQRLTAEKGLFYLSCMEGTATQSGFEKTSFTGDQELYITYYPRQVIEALLREFGFAVKKFDAKDYPETDGTFTTDLIYIAEKRDDT